MSKASSLSHEAMRKAEVRLVTGSMALREELAVENGVLASHGMGVTELNVTSAKLQLIHTPTTDATLALTIYTPESTPGSSTHVRMANNPS